MPDPQGFGEGKIELRKCFNIIFKDIALRD